MRKEDDRKKEKKKKKRRKEEKNGVFSGHYVIASSLPPERRPLESRTLVPKFTFYCIFELLGTITPKYNQNPLKIG